MILSRNFVFMTNRNRVLNRFTLEATVCLDERDTVKSVKFIARWYSKLTNIMECINFCYSIQVLQLVSIIRESKY